MTEPGLPRCKETKKFNAVALTMEHINKRKQRSPDQKVINSSTAMSVEPKEKKLFYDYPRTPLLIRTVVKPLTN